MNEYEFKVIEADGTETIDSWVGSTVEEAARRLLACKYPGGKVIAWRAPSHTVTTALIRGC